jgi:hypothetical protein
VHHEAADGGKIGVDWGSRVTFVHHGALNSPASPNPPGKNAAIVAPVRE